MAAHADFRQTAASSVLAGQGFCSHKGNDMATHADFITADLWFVVKLSLEVFLAKSVIRFLSDLRLGYWHTNQQTGTFPCI